MGFDKPSSAEEEFIKREEAARRQREAIGRAQHMGEEELAQLKQAHYMKCPKCGFDLHEVALQEVKVDVCEHCNGMWLDAHELQALMNQSSGGWLKNLKRFVTGEG